MHRVRSLLRPQDWLYALSLLLPLGLYNLALKWEHISHVGALGWFTTLNLLRSNLLFSLGFGVVWAGLLALSRGGRARRVIVAMMHATSLAYAVVVTAAHHVFAVTGSSLDYSLIALAITSFNERAVFVRYRTQHPGAPGQATSRRDLRWLSGTDKS